jgi:hypothetical protein
MIAKIITGISIMLKTLLFSLVAMTSLVNIANAGIISGNPIPTDMSANGSNESNTDIFLYAERQNLILGSDLNVDYLAGSGLPGNIVAGTAVNSFILNFDAVGTDTGGATIHSMGTHLFNTPILAIIWTGKRPPAQPQTANNLDASDSILGVPGTNYPNGLIGRGLELEDFYATNGTNDFFTIVGNQLSLSVFTKSNYIEQIRVITASSVSEPTALLLFGSAIALFGFRRFSK